MASRLRRLSGVLRRRAENVAVALLALVFVSFLLQVTFRYLLGWPVGWTLEVSTLAWMWLVLWGAAFVTRAHDDIRFDILSSMVPARVQQAFVVVTGFSLVLVLVVSLPAVVDYVTFMRIERASYIGVRLDLLFSIFVVFQVALIVRYSARIWGAVRGRTARPSDE